MAQIYLQQLEDFFKKTWTLIDERLRPNPQHTQTRLQQEIIHKRNKAVFAMFFVYQFFFIYDILSSKNSFIKNLASLVAIHISIFTLFLSCRYHPQIFNSSQNIMGLLFGPLILDAGPESLSYALMTANFTPLLVQVVTGSYTHYMLNSLGQLALLNTLYKKPIEEMISLHSPEKVQHYLTTNASFILFLQTFVVVLLHRFLAQTQEQTLVLEQKKNEEEIQKTFFLSFSHELKNLVNSLIGNIKLASIENIGGRAKGILQNAEVCGELLLHMINNILDSGKAAIGDLEVDPIPTKTYEAFERIWEICSELIRRKDLKGYMKIPKNLPRIMMLDQHRLTQIFLNLIDNAIKFTEKGSIEIKVEWLANRNIVNEKCFQPYPFNICDEQDEGLFEKEQSFTNLDEHYSILGTAGKGVEAHKLLSAPASRKGILKIVVTDKGCGMSKEQIDKLFQKFTQVTTDATKKKLGTGLGLFITKQLCHRMNGEIRVFSKKSCGSSFVFCIPVDVVFDNNQFLGNQETLRRHLISKNLRAMIVDDIPSNHTILKAFFENVGIQVSSIALNGLEAYRKYAEYGPQIIAMDLDMPIMDGKLASQKIRELEEEKGLEPVFLMIISENCIESELFECVDKKGRIRADALLKKPLRIGDLIGAIASHFLYQ